MGNTAAAYFGMDKAYITVEESIAGITNIVSPIYMDLCFLEVGIAADLKSDQIASATREETSGKFWEYTGKQCQW